MIRFFSKKLIVIGSTLFSTTMLSACSLEKQEEANGFKFEDIEISHNYEAGNLTMTVDYPEEYEGMDVKINLEMPDMDHEIKEVPLEKKNQVYTAIVDLPMDGIWDINYSFKKDKKTYYNSFTEIFGQVAEEQKKDYTADLIIQPEPILPNQKTEFEIKLTDKDVNIIENAEVKLKFHFENTQINKNMRFEDESYKTEVNFEEKGIYHLTILIKNKNTNKLYEEELEIPVGVSTNLEQEDHSNHH